MSNSLIHPTVQLITVRSEWVQVRKGDDLHALNTC